MKYKGIISYLGTISAKLVSMCLNPAIHIELYVQVNFQSSILSFCFKGICLTRDLPVLYELFQVYPWYLIPIMAVWKPFSFSCAGII